MRRTNNNRTFFYAVLNHTIWSTQTVASRYLQVYARPMFDGQGVLATSKATSFILLCCCGQYFCPEEKSQRDEELTMHTLSSSCDFRNKVLFAGLFGVVTTLRAALNIASGKFTLSFYLTAINSLTPIVTSIFDSLVLHTQLPQALWPCVILSFVGCLIIGISQSPVASSSPSDFTFSSQDAVGCALQFASMCFSATARLLMKRTEGILSRNEAVQTNNTCNFAFPLVYTILTNPSGWKAFANITTESFLALSIVSILVYTIGSTGQMSLVRSMGPGMYSSLGGIRVVGSAVLSTIWLNEPVNNWIEWLGLMLIVIAMTIYTLDSVGIPTFLDCCRMDVENVVDIRIDRNNNETTRGVSRMESSPPSESSLLVMKTSQD